MAKGADMLTRDVGDQAALTQTLIGPTDWNPSSEHIGQGLEAEEDNPRRQLSVEEVTLMIASLREHFAGLASSYRGPHADVIRMANEGLGPLETALTEGRVRVFHRMFPGAYALSGGQELPAISVADLEIGVVSLFISSATTAHAPAEDLQALLGLFHEGLESMGFGHATATVLEGLLDPELADENVDPNRVGISPRFRAQLALMNDRQMEEFVREHESGAVEVQLRHEVETQSLPEEFLEYALAHAQAMHEAAKVAKADSGSRGFGIDDMNLLKGRDSYVMTDILTDQYCVSSDYQRQQMLGVLEGFLNEVDGLDTQVLSTFAHLADSSHQRHLLDFLSRTDDLKAQGVLIEALGRVGTSRQVSLVLRDFIDRTEPDVYNEDQWFFFSYRDRVAGLRTSLQKALRQLAQRGFGEEDFEVDLELIEDQESRSGHGMRRYSRRRGISLAGGFVGTAIIGSYLAWTGAFGNLLPASSGESEGSATTAEQTAKTPVQGRTETRRDLYRVYRDIPHGTQRPFIAKEIVPLLKPFQAFDPVTHQLGTGEKFRAGTNVAPREQGVVVLNGRQATGLFIAEIRNGLGRYGKFEQFGPIRVVPSGKPTGEFVEQILITRPMRAGQRVRLPLLLDGRFAEASSSLGGVLSIDQEGWLSPRRYIDTRELKLSIEKMSRNSQIEASQPDTPWLRKELEELRANPSLAPIREEMARARGGSLQARGETLVELSQKYLGYSRTKRIRMDMGVVKSWMDLLALVLDRDGRFYADCDVLHAIVFVWARSLGIDAVYAIGLLDGNGDAVLTEHEGHAALIARLGDDLSKNPWQMLDVTGRIPQSSRSAARDSAPEEPSGRPSTTAAEAPGDLSRPQQDLGGAPVDRARVFDPRGHTVQFRQRIPRRPERTARVFRPEQPSGRPSTTAVELPADLSRAEPGGQERVADSSRVFDPTERTVAPAQTSRSRADREGVRQLPGILPGLEEYIGQGSTTPGEALRQQRTDEERALFLDYGPEWYEQRLAGLRLALVGELQYPDADTHVEVQELLRRKAAGRELSPEDERLLLGEVSRELGIRRFRRVEKIEILEEVIVIGEGILAEANREPSSDEAVLVDIEANAGSMAIRIDQEGITAANRNALKAEVLALVEALGTGPDVADIESYFQDQNFEKVLLITARNQNDELIGISLAHDFSLVDPDSFTWLSHSVATTSANLKFPDNVLFQSFLGVQELWQDKEITDALRDMLIRLGKSRGYAYMLSETKLHIDFDNQALNAVIAPGGFVIGHTFEFERQDFLSQYFVPLKELEELEKQLPEYPGIRVLKKMAFGKQRLFSFFWESQRDKPSLLYVVVSDPAADRKVTGFWLHEGNRSEQESVYPELREFDLAMLSPEAA